MKECAAIQSNVISITSTEENDFLTRLTGNIFFNSTYVCFKCYICVPYFLSVLFKCIVKTKVLYREQIYLNQFIQYSKPYFKGARNIKGVFLRSKTVLKQYTLSLSPQLEVCLARTIFSKLTRPVEVTKVYLKFCLHTF